MAFLSGTVVEAARADALGIVSYDNPEKQIYFYDGAGSSPNGTTIDFEIVSLEIPYIDNGINEISVVECGRLKGKSLPADIDQQFRLNGLALNGGSHPKRLEVQNVDYLYDTTKYKNVPTGSNCDFTRFLHNGGTERNPDWIKFAKDIVEVSLSL